MGDLNKILEQIDKDLELNTKPFMNSEQLTQHYQTMESSLDDLTSEYMRLFDFDKIKKNYQTQFAILEFQAGSYTIRNARMKTLSLDSKEEKRKIIKKINDEISLMEPKERERISLQNLAQNQYGFSIARTSTIISLANKGILTIDDYTKLLRHQIDQ